MLFFSSLHASHDNEKSFLSFFPLLYTRVFVATLQRQEGAIHFLTKLYLKSSLPFNKLIHLHSTFATRQFLQIKLNIRSVLFLMIFLANIYNVA